MRPAPPDDRDLATFAPRVTGLILFGLLLSLCSAGLYVLPILMEPAPAGAIPDYFEQRVQARLEGKLPWFLAGSFLAVAWLSIRGWLPGSRRRSG
ncbi:MAG: hypothetical protein VX614_03205 [Myxococcota bacterium]|nr:hypothetical protein [Myxococcota bacterium]